MTPGARVAAKIEVLDAVLLGVPAEKALTNWGRNNRFAGSKDRAAIRDLVFQAIRCRRSSGASSAVESGAKHSSAFPQLVPALVMQRGIFCVTAPPIRIDSCCRVASDPKGRGHHGK